jgi:hypothetical protein
MDRNLEARKKIDALKLSETEWERVGIFCGLLSVSFIRFELFLVYYQLT